MNNAYSFEDLLDKKLEFGADNKSVCFDKIEIPKIQRDYVQGRKENSFEINETGRRFVDAIFKALFENKVMEMDFVYGSIVEYESNENKENAFIPLDGQQRLTTLFLLHWYIGLREEKGDLMSLRKFTYSTRISSRRFCECLCDDNKTKLLFEEKPSKEISNLPWFFFSYKKDPTIRAMLNMLDAIHERYCTLAITSLYERLGNLKFYILPLAGFNLTEDLYIKMNARGKPLTDYENFKADLIKWMKDNDNPQKIIFKEVVNYDNRDMPFYMAISQKMDNKWANFFFSNTEISQENKLPDALFMRFIYRYFTNYYIQKKLDDSVKYSDIKIDNFESESTFQSFDSFEEMLNRHDDGIKNFEKILDNLAEHWDVINTLINPCWSNGYTFLDEKITDSQRTVFFGITLFLERNTFRESNFKQWTRTVWNLVENTDISDKSSMIGVMALLYELSPKSEDIYLYLSSNPEIRSQSSKNALAEEISKCRFIYQNRQFDENWENAFINAEKHEFFKGSVGFLISDNMIIEDFNKRTVLAEKVFDSKGINAKYREDGHIFLRALISKYDKYEHIIWKNLIDVDEKEHYLKKMLASDKTIRNSTVEWFSLADEDALRNALLESVNNASQMTGWDANDDRTQHRMRRIHETLYRESDLQNWMQQEKAIRLGWRSSVLYISRPGSWYDWILIDGYRNEIISRLMGIDGCSTQNQCKYGNKNIPFFYGNDKIILKRMLNNCEFKYIFDADKVRVGSSSVSNPHDIDPDKQKVYRYQAEVAKEDQIDVFLEKIEHEVFNCQNQDSLIAKLDIN